MTSEKLTVQEKQLASRLWEMSSDSGCSPSDRVSAFKSAPQKVCDAVDEATLKLHYRKGFGKNPFNH